MLLVLKQLYKIKFIYGLNNFHDTEGKKGTHKQIISKALYNKVNNVEIIA